MQESLLVGLVRVGVRMDAHRCWFLRKVWEFEVGPTELAPQGQKSGPSSTLRRSFF